MKKTTGSGNEQRMPLLCPYLTRIWDLPPFFVLYYFKVQHLRYLLSVKLRIRELLFKL